MNSSCDIIAKVVQTSPLKYRRNGELPIKFLALQDTPNEGPVKIALFGEDAQRDFNEGDVLSVTQTYRWKDTQTLSTKKSTKIEYLPQDSLILQQTGPCFNDDDFSADTTNSLGSEPEEFQIMGITSAHKYQCCPNSECRNKKLENDSCPTCKGKSLTRQTYFSAAQVVLRRSDGSYEMRKIFHTDLKLLCEMPDLNTMEEDPALYQFLTGLLPINARGLFLNGKITIMSTKRQHDR
ncbi:uncharacterized protein LOC128230956 [Mya arenaria]|uniref:uncharacterized protein LOC128230956 n=1 Tax=Mya arenaria TaxID=6604 RepID=UPI0022E8D471|nr:uncharacterized protein LOC128230956 [Mya arenaria]